MIVSEDILCLDSIWCQGGKKFLQHSKPIWAPDSLERLAKHCFTELINSQPIRDTVTSGSVLGRLTSEVYDWRIASPDHTRHGYVFRELELCRTSF